MYGGLAPRADRENPTVQFSVGGRLLGLSLHQTPPISAEFKVEALGNGSSLRLIGTYIDSNKPLYKA